MSLPDTSVKHFSSDMPGAPVLSGTAGTLIAVLDACLVNGFGSVSVDSLSVTDNVATAIVSTGHGLAMVGNTGPVILISGATPAELNGVWRVTGVPNASTFTFAVEGVSNGTATGTITAKRAPAGWSKRYSGTNKAVYARTDPAATAMLLRVDDTGTTAAPVKSYQTMSDVDTGTGAWPTGDRYCIKSSLSNSTARSWQLIADTRAIYLIVNASGSTTWDEFAFGDVIAYRSPDANACFMSAGVTTSANQNTFHDFNQTLGRDLAGSYTQLPGGVPAAFYSHGRGSAMGQNAQTYPAPADNAFHGWPIEIWEGTSIARGLLPGIYNPIHVTASTITDRTIVSNVPQLNGRDLILTYVRGTNASVAFDLTGPWRD